MSNLSGVALPSAARTTTTSSADFVNLDSRGIVVVLDVTAITATPLLTLTIQGKDVASGKYYTLLTGAVVGTVSTNTYVLFPGVTETANVDVAGPLPHTFRITVTHGDADSATYSVGFSTVS